MSKKSAIQILTVLTLLSAVPALSGCHTTAGLGQDVSKTGQAVNKAANQATPSSP
jgi:predicted small secreted protein